MKFMKKNIFCFLLLGCSLLFGCYRNIEDKRSEFEKATTTTPVETTDKQTDEVESSTAEPSFIEWGIYVSNDNSNEFFSIDDLYITFWDISKIDEGKLPGYYKDKGLPQCCKKYDRREFFEQNDMFVSDDKIILDNVEYSYCKDFLYNDINDFNINYSGISQYDQIINKLINIRFSENQYNNDEYHENGFSRIWYMNYVFQHAGFYIVDLDDDGSPELMLGENDYNYYSPNIYEIYTIVNGEVVKLCNGASRNCYHLCENNLIYSDGYGSVNDPIEGYHKLENGAFVFQRDNGYRYPDEGTIPIEFTFFCLPKLN